MTKPDAFIHQLVKETTDDGLAALAASYSGDWEGVLGFYGYTGDHGEPCGTGWLVYRYRVIVNELQRRGLEVPNGGFVSQTCSGVY